MVEYFDVDLRRLTKEGNVYIQSIVGDSNSLLIEFVSSIIDFNNTILHNRETRNKNKDGVVVEMDLETLTQSIVDMLYAFYEQFKDKSFQPYKYLRLSFRLIGGKIVITNELVREFDLKA